MTTAQLNLLEDGIGFGAIVKHAERKRIKIEGNRLNPMLIEQSCVENQGMRVDLFAASPAIFRASLAGARHHHPSFKQGMNVDAGSVGLIDNERPV